jgi:uncharacterized protein YbbC (DUF1343 family)
MKTGLDVLIGRDFADVAGKRVGLVTHAAALARDNRSVVQAFAQARNCTLAAIFGPEHGLTGEAQDLIAVKNAPQSQFKSFSLYGDTFESLTPTAAMLAGLDVLVIDMQDVGSRYYTFQATMLYCMQACAAVGVPVMVLDRPNPLGRTIEGPLVAAGFESFVGVHAIPIRHGLTIGELARLYQAERVPNVELAVIACEDYDPKIEPVWTLPPSPNMPTLETAIVYPGQCLIEGSNLSEGRGTTRPFEYVGAPGVSPTDIATRLTAFNLPGIAWIPLTFRPTFQKHAGQSCGGVFLKVTDVDMFQPVRTGVAVLMAFRDAMGARFHWRTETYEFVSNIPAIDLLFGSARERAMIDAGARFDEMISQWPAVETAFESRRRPYLLY